MFGIMTFMKVENAEKYLKSAAGKTFLKTHLKE